MDEDEDDEQEEEEEEVVVDRDYYYDGYKDYNEEPPTEPSVEKSLSEKEIMNDVKSKKPHDSSHSASCPFQRLSIDLGLCISNVPFPVQ